MIKISLQHGFHWTVNLFEWSWNRSIEWAFFSSLFRYIKIAFKPVSMAMGSIAFAGQILIAVSGIEFIRFDQKQN